MFNSISKPFGALNALSENVLALAGSIGEMSTNLRHRVGLDMPQDMPALPPPAALEPWDGPTRAKVACTAPWATGAPSLLTSSGASGRNPT